MPAAARLAQVVEGDLDAALVRGVTSHPALRLEQVWEDELVAALPTRHPLTDDDAVALVDLAPLPLRLPTRESNPTLVDAVLRACRAAGFEPALTAAMNDQDMLAAIGAGPPTWTVYYAPKAGLLDGGAAGVAFRPLAAPGLRMVTLLALPADPTPAQQALAAACRTIA